MKNDLKQINEAIRDKKLCKLPAYVVEGIERGRQQSRNGQTKSTDEVMRKYEKKHI